MTPVDDERAPRQAADAIAPPMRTPMEHDSLPPAPFGREPHRDGYALRDSGRNRVPLRAGPSARGPESGRPADSPWPSDPDRRGVAPRAQDSGRHPDPRRAPDAPRGDGAGPPRPAAGRPVRRDESAHGGEPTAPPRRSRPGEPLPRPVPTEPDGPPTDVYGATDTRNSHHRYRPVGRPAAVPRGKSGRTESPTTRAGRPPAAAGATSTSPPSSVHQSPPTPAAGRVHQSPPATAGRVHQSPPGPPRAGRAEPGTASGRRPSRPTVPSDDDAGAPPAPRRSVTRHGKGPTVTRHTPRTLGRALLATTASAVIPGTGLFMIRRRRAGALVLGVFLLIAIALLIMGFTIRRAALVQNLLSSRVLLVVMVGLIVAGLAWVTQVVRTYALARPRSLNVGSRVVGVLVVAALCLLVATPFGFAANLVNSQRALLNNLFGGGGGTSVADAINKPRLNILLVGSDAGPDRTGARTDTMMMASIDTTTARTTLFALPRNIGYAQFPPDTPMAEQFPKGFHDAANPLSGNYLLNAVYAWGLDHPQMAPTTPTNNPGLNLLHESVAYMMGVDIDYYVEVNMAGFASIIDAVGGVTVDVGPVPLPIGGVLPDGRHVKPSGYVPAGVQHLDGNDALWFARSRRDSDDYNRMGRQRCLLQSLLQQKSPTDVITHFNDIAAATKNSVTTNIPQEVLGALVSLADEKPPSLQSISFDPNLPDPNQPDGHFNTSHVDVSYMREVVQNAFVAPEPAPAPTTTAAAPTTTSARGATTTPTATPSATPESLACG